MIPTAARILALAWVAVLAAWFVASWLDHALSELGPMVSR